MKTRWPNGWKGFGIHGCKQPTVIYSEEDKGKNERMTAQTMEMTSEKW